MKDKEILSIEEKAKRYDEAIEKLRDFYRDYDTVSLLINVKEELANIFPELKESEDEEVRKALIFHFQGDGFLCNKVGNIPNTDILAWLEKQGDASRTYELGFTEGQRIERKWWLEKQGEQKEYTFKSLPRLLDMIEPTSKAKAYCQKLIDALVKEGYTTDAKIVGECLKAMNGENVPMAIMDEKQGEQKPTDKVEPKFHEGDWAVSKLDRKARRISEVHHDEYNDYYVVEGNEYDIEEYDRRHHLWTIQDAKAGDVLASVDGLSILIFRNLETYETFSSYYNIEGKGELHWSNECFIPATKEQRDKLEKAMADTGYTFDFDKKELKKIEQKPAEWSEEDEKYVKDLVAYFTGGLSLKHSEEDIVNWLKDLENRVQPKPKQEWSEEDEDNFKHLMNEIAKIIKNEDRV